MFGRTPHPGGAKPPSTDVQHLTTCLAFMAMLLVTPLVIQHSIHWVEQLAHAAYGGDPLAEYVPGVFKIAAWPTVFFILKCSLAAAVSAGAVALALRLI
jgi:hypothetical protein